MHCVSTIHIQLIYKELKMKCVFSIIFLYFLIISKSTAEDIIHFPDSAFKNAILKHFDPSFIPIDLNGDGEIQQSEADVVKSLFLGDSNIKDMTGIKQFKNLEQLRLYDTYKLNSLDISNMDKLYYYEMVNNPYLKSLNISNCPKMYSIFVGSENGLYTVDLKNCISLSGFYGDYNNLEYLDFSGCKNLKTITCDSNKLKSLITDSLSKIEGIGCSNNNLNQIILFDKSALWRLDIPNNKMTNLLLNGAIRLEHLNVDSNDLESLSIRNGNNHLIKEFSTLGNPNLKCISVDDAEYSYQNWKNIDPWTEFSEDCNTNIKEKELPNFKIYPNPAENEILFERFDTEPQTIKIFDMLGNVQYFYQLRQYESVVKIDISSYPKGIYFIESGNEILVREKFVVE